jgi:hypothetical protein
MELADAGYPERTFRRKRKADDDRSSRGAHSQIVWSEAAAPSLLPGLLLGRFCILGYLYAGEEIEIARRM